jgi:hypothetical protein
MQSLTHQLDRLSLLPSKVGVIHDLRCTGHQCHHIHNERPERIEAVIKRINEYINNESEVELEVVERVEEVDDSILQLIYSKD